MILFYLIKTSLTWLFSDHFQIKSSTGNVGRGGAHGIDSISLPASAKKTKTKDYRDI